MYDGGSVGICVMGHSALEGLSCGGRSGVEGQGIAMLEHWIVWTFVSKGGGWDIRPSDGNGSRFLGSGVPRSAGWILDNGVLG